MPQQGNHPAKRKLDSIQALRAVAATGVVAYHAVSRLGGSFTIGQAGVDVFFVISGFIMWVVTRQAITPASFLRDRVARVVPLYWAATLAMALGAVAGLFPNIHLHGLLAAVLRSLLFIPYSTDGQHAWPLLVPGWTLNYEMFFYLVFAAVLPFGARQQAAGLLAVLCGLAVLGLATGPVATVQGFYTSSIVLEFAFGVVLARASLRHVAPRPMLGGLLLLLGIAGLTAAALLQPDAARVLAWGVPALLLVSGAVWLEQAGIALAPRPVVYLGNASYSIYLTHPFVVSAGAKFLPHALQPVGWAVLTAAALALGCAVHELAERPMLRLFKRPRQRRDDVAVTGKVLP